MGTDEEKLRTLLSDSLRADAPATLSHITHLEAMVSILCSQVMWARRSTDVKRDAEELRAGEELALDVVRALRSAERKPVAQQVLSEFVRTFHRERISVKAVVYLSCFTPRVDQVHWQRYGDVAVTFDVRQPKGNKKLPARSDVVHALREAVRTKNLYHTARAPWPDTARSHRQEVAV